MTDHLYDIEADMMAVYGVQDAMSLPGPRFFRLAYRLPCYAQFTPDGVPYGTVLATRLAAEMADERRAGASPASDDDREEVPVSALVGIGEIVRA
jgi:hypothetical protein